MFYLGYCRVNTARKSPPSLIVIVTYLSVTRDEIWIGNRTYWTLTLMTTNNYASLIELHTPKSTVTAVHTNSSQSLLVIAWYQLPMMVVPLPLGSQTAPSLSYQLFASHNWLFHYCVFSRCQGNVSTELFPSNSCCTVTCLHSCYLAVGLHVTVCYWYIMQTNREGIAQTECCLHLNLS
jgi:hypothetical protein